MSFKDWLENADMPTRDKDGRWFDQEDGLYYEQTAKKITFKSELRKQQEKELAADKKRLKKEVEAYQARDWKTISFEEKKVFYEIKHQYEKIATKKIRFDLFEVKIENTYKHKEEIKFFGGKWEPIEKKWFVPSDNLEYLLKAIK